MFVPNQTHPYYQIQQLSYPSGEICYLSKPGLPHWDQVSPAEELLSRLDLACQAKVILWNQGPCAWVVTLAKAFPACQFLVMSNHSLSLVLTEQSAQANQLENLSVSYDIYIDPSQSGQWDSVVISLPKGRKLARRWLMQAFQALRPAGNLYLTGANREGIQPAIQDAERLLGRGSILAYKKGNRLARLTKPSHFLPLPDWSCEPGIAPHTWHQFDINLQGRALSLHSLPGVFSYEHIDEGTALLLDNLTIQAGDRVVDVGCGYGPIGLWADIQGASLVDMVDVDSMAVACSQENIQINGCNRARVFTGDILGWSEPSCYNLVVSNPPFHAGREVDLQVAGAFIQDARRVLMPGGRLVLVANRFLRYDYLMKDLFGAVNILVETGKYHILESQRGK